ncbi:MAG: MFS transporter [Gammaproteobacteria bacterium]|nr:MAG: MFS transporter [Gammaproteobacteria bacterium]
MSTIVVVQKGGRACIAADTLTTFGDVRLDSSMDVNHSKIQTFGGTHMGIVGSAAHTLVAERAFRDPELDVNFSDRDHAFDTLLRLHPVLKERYYLNAKDSDEDPYESTRMDAVFINANGIFAMFSLREVYQYARFWAIGSGACYALGAMHAVYDRLRSAKDIARAGAEAGAAFDTASDLPLTFRTVQLAK